MNNLYRSCIIAMFLLSFFLLPGYSYGQNPGATRGRIMSTETREPLPGATIRIKNGAAVTRSEYDGTFTIEANVSKDTLVISYIGYSPVEIVLHNVSSNFIVVGLDVLGRQMKEVVVSTGYQNLPQERATGSFTTVNQALINRRVSTDLISRLEDVTSGLSFDRRADGQPSLTIRGRSTILANSQPLIVVDNFPYDGDINNINPNDVEKVTVLKDAAAASIWGSRAGNGVIVITTKKARLNQPLKIEFNANVTVGEKPNIFNNRNFLNPEDFIEVEKKLFDNGFFDGDLEDPTAPPVSPVVRLLSGARNGTINTNDANAQIDLLKKQDVRNDFNRYFYRKSVSQQYAFNMSGSGYNSTYLFSGGYDRNLENAIGNDNNRITLNAANTFRPLKKLEVSMNMVYTGTNQQNNNPGYTSINSGGGYGKNLYPYAKLADGAGNPLSIVKDFSTDFIDNAPANGYLNWQYKPLQDLRTADKTTRQNDIRINSAVRYDINSWLSALLSYQYQRSSLGLREYNSDASYTARNLINLYAQNDGSGTLSFPIPKGGILDQMQSVQSAHSGRAQLSIDRSIGEMHKISAIAGFEARQSKVTGNTYRLFGYNDQILTSQPVNEADYFYISSLDYEDKIPTNYALLSQTDRYLSYFANSSYTYANRYIVSGSIRKDESNLFGVKANQKGVPLWSAGLGWIASNESFLNLSWLPYLKVRASYGFNGNVIKSVTAFTVAGYDTDPLTGLPFASIKSPPNPNLRWERIKIINLGIDFEAFDRRLSGSLEYYHKDGLDLIGDSPLDPTTGFFIADKFSYRGNNAAIKGNGFDVNLNSVNMSGKFGWKTHYLFSYANSVVTHYDYQQAASSYSVFNPPPLEGRPQYSIYSFRSAGLNPENGNPRVMYKGVASEDYTGYLNSLTAKDLVYNGPALPPYFGAIRNTITWKDFEASFNITYKFGYYFRKSSINYSGLYYSWQGNSDFEKRWQKLGDEAHTVVPSMPEVANTNRDRVYLNSDALVEKGDNIRLQDISLSYNLSKLKFKKLPFAQLQIYAYANNVAILWRANHDHLDPDFSSAVYPPSKTFSLGLRANF
jgi:TonB-linked SusC/RagA family outer membrane protein